jgi:phosphoribosylanthranilate isomerase
MSGQLGGAVLVDGPLGGGRGVAADTNRVAAVAQLRPVVLAGGLTPDTVGPSIARVRPFGVDVSSGVEQAPGVKDPARIHAFLQAVRAVEDV